MLGSVGGGWVLFFLFLSFGFLMGFKDLIIIYYLGLGK